MDSFYLNQIKAKFLSRREKNPKYSIRAYAKYLKLDPSTLSKILKGSRSLSIDNASEISKRLGLKTGEEEKFLKSVLNHRKNLKENQKTQPEKGSFEWTVLKEEAYSEVIRDWEYYAVLNLTEVDDFIPEIEHISQRLGISEERANAVVENLLDLCLLEREPDGSLNRLKNSLFTSNNVKSKDLQEAHIQELDLMKLAIKFLPVELRTINSFTVVTNPQAIEKAKAYNLKYIKKMMNILESGPKTEVYSGGAFLFPLTKAQGDKK